MQSRRKQINAAVVVAIVFLSLAQLTCAATVPESVPLGRFVRVQLDEGEKAIVLSQEFAPVDIIAGDKMIAFTGLPGRYVVVVLKGDEQPQQFFTQITGAVPPNPPQPPQPPGPVLPRPSGLAGEVYDQAIKINQPKTCLTYAARLDSVISQIGAGALRDINSTQAAIRSSMAGVAPGDPWWIEFGKWINQAANSRPETNTLSGMKDFLTEVVAGLDAAGGGR